jgi:hypothetical protein
MDGYHAERRLAEEERNGLYENAYLQELKGESDYRAQFVKRLNEEIARERAEMEEHANTDDEDLYNALGEAAIAWFQERLEEQKVWAENALENYTEIKLRWDTTVARQAEYSAIIVEWIHIYELEREA